MKAPVLQYHAPATLNEALQMLSQVDNARILAGGQSLMAMLNMRFAFPDCLIDVNRIGALSYLRDGEQGIEIGAMTRQRGVEFSELVQTRLPLWHEAILNVGHRQTRNRGTVGGSLCQLDPSAEIPTVALAMDAVLTVAGVRGTRSVKMADFPAGYMTPAMDPDEMLIAIRVEPWPAAHGHAFIEFARRHGDFAIVSAAALVLFADDGRLQRVSLTLGGVASAPLRMHEAEAVLLGSRGEAADLAHAARLCAAIDAVGDSYVPSWYRQRLAGVLAQRALALAIERAHNHTARQE
ncbi:xanthine dehydrogenase family protein subunit M [Achromobacter sp. UMC46]|uniref:FAD binding domain-containing protein n=1 Tax=Achromobacter sp. UMC46 TaxID=1862319 RepID=UPI0015FEED75|nr:xanthine dehydrogenase family protein subunit M [Achromobacter sp. UMC46]MBB1597134.1 molybdopterin dehydrogenase [Achromobacter sp. UMC46]